MEAPNCNENDLETPRMAVSSTCMSTCCTLEIHLLGPESHVSHIDEGERKLHERCLVSGVPPCYRLVGEPSRKAAGRPCTMANAECTVSSWVSCGGTVQTAAVRVAIQYPYLTVQLYYMYYFIADAAAASAMQERAAPSHASD